MTLDPLLLFNKRDVRTTTNIHGRIVVSRKGKSTKKPRKTPNPNEVRDVPSHIVKNYLKVGLYIDVMLIKSIMFLTRGAYSVYMYKEEESREISSYNSNSQGKICVALILKTRL